MFPYSVSISSAVWLYAISLSRMLTCYKQGHKTLEGNAQQTLCLLVSLSYIETQSQQEE
jgi:hypothetical protein